MIEPNLVDASLIEGALVAAHEPLIDLVTARCFAAGIEQLRSADFDVVLVDLSEASGPVSTTLDQIRSVAPKVPCVALAAVTDEAVAVEALTCGAQDYLIKEGPYFALLTRAIRYAIERARAEAALQEREQYFQLMIENVSDIIAVIDANLSCRYVSPAIERVCEIPQAELIGHSIDQIVHPDDIDRLADRTARRLRGEGDPEGFTEIRARHAQGDWRWLQLRAKRYDDPSGEPVIVVAARDVTECRRLEEELRSTATGTES